MNICMAVREDIFKYFNSKNSKLPDPVETWRAFNNRLLFM
jgi:hypothetical protein